MKTVFPPQPPTRSNSGRWLVVALFVLAGAIVLGFYLAPYKFDPPPPAAAWGRPGRAIRVLSIDAPSAGSLDQLIARVKLADADVVLVQRIEGAAVDSFAVEIGLAQVGHVQVYYPAQNVPGAEPTYGNAVFSKFPLYEGRSIPNKGGSFGVWATAVVDGKKFLVASARLSTPPPTEAAMLSKAWQELGSPPMIAGGDWAGATLPGTADATHGVLLWGGWETHPLESGDGVECR